LSTSRVKERYGVPTIAFPTVAVRSPIGRDFQFSAFARATSCSKRSCPLKTVLIGRVTAPCVLSASANAKTKIKIPGRITDCLLRLNRAQAVPAGISKGTAVSNCRLTERRASARPGRAEARPSVVGAEHALDPGRARLLHAVPSTILATARSLTFAHAPN